MAQFEKAIEKILLEEGGYSNKTSDLGGETSFGISKRQYPNLDISNLTKIDAIKIYRTDYWNTFRLDEITNQDIANFIFDMVVNMNPESTGFIVQKAMNSLGANIKVDGVIGSITINQINNCINPHRLLDKIRLERITHHVNVVSKNKSQIANLEGWIKRSLRA